MQVPKIFYTGSLFQNNFKEASDEKGLMKIDLEKDTVEFIPIENLTRFVTIDVPEFDEFKESWIDTLDIDSSTFVRLRVKQNIQTPNRSYTNLLRSLINEKKNPIDIVVLPIYVDQTINESLVDNLNEKLENIEDINVINQFIREYAEDMNFQEHLETLLTTNAETFKSLNLKPIEKVNFTIKQFNFGNIFTYSDTNGISFNRTGIIGIFGKNKHGKSNFLNSLFYAIYGETFRKYSNKSIVNVNRDSCETFVQLEDTRGNIYTIQRTIKKKSNKRTVDFKINDIPKNEEDVGQTDKAIQTYLGTFDQFQYSNISFQGKISQILELKNTDRKVAFLQFFDLGIFEKLYKIANDVLKEYRTKLKIYNQVDIGSQILEYKEFIRRETVNKQESNNNISLIENTLIEKQKIQEELKQSIKQLPQDIKSESHFKSLISTVNTKILNDEKTIDANKNLIKQNNEQIIFSTTQIDELTESLNSFRIALQSLNYNADNIALLSEIQNDLKAVLNEKNKDENKRVQYEQIVKSLEKNIDVLSKQPWMRTEQICKSCILASDAFKSDKELTSVNESLKIIIEKIENNKGVIAEYEQLIVGINKDADIKADIERIKNSINSTEVKIESFKQKIESLYQTNEVIEKTNIVLLESVEQQKLMINQYNDEILKLNQYSNIIKENELINQQISNLAVDINELNKRYKELIVTISTIDFKIKDYETKIEQLKETQKIIIDLEMKIKIYDIYVNLMHKDGLPIRLLKRLLKYVEQKANYLLSQCSELKIEFQIENEDLNIVYYDGKDEDSKDVLSMSGFESTFIGLCLRTALSQVNTKQKADFLVIDEGMGTLDADNLINIRDLFNTMKAEFRFILLITHLDIIKDYVDHKINIYRDDKFSYLTI